MDLLEKFEAIEIKTDTRISPADRTFCEAHQAAYENARDTLSELKYIWEDMERQQSELLSPVNALSHSSYLTSHDGLKLSPADIQKQIDALHVRFVEELISHFCASYHCSISSETVKETLFPQKPSNRWDDNYEEQVESYTKKLRALRLHYVDVLEQLFVQTEGKAFSEYALCKLKEKCHRAAWSSTTKKAVFERKKTVLQFTRYACYYQIWLRNEYWELSDGSRNLLLGIAHFETGSLSVIPGSLSEIIQSYRLEASQFSFPNCAKVQSLKLFKNGRMDIRFTNESHAVQFVEDYLGTVY